MRSARISKLKIQLSEALYYNPAKKRAGDLRAGLTHYSFLMNSLIKTAEHLKAGNIHEFDALVGDNACQIRAIRTVSVYKALGLKRLDELLDSGRSKLSKIEELLKSKLINILMRKMVSFNEVICDYELSLSLTADEFFIFESFLLCQAKSCMPDDEFMPDLLRKEKYSVVPLKKKYPSLSYSFISKITNNLRIRISKESVDYVRAIAKNLGKSNLCRCISSKSEIFHNKLSCLPAYWSFQALFYYAQKKEIPLVFHAKFLAWTGKTYQVVDEDFLFYKVREDSGLYEIHEPNDFCSKEPICVIEGALTANTSKKAWRKRLLSQSPLDILFAAGADHRQYPDESLQLPEKDDSYKSFKRRAIQEGFALENSSTFFTRHIYPATFSFFSDRLEAEKELRYIFSAPLASEVSS